MSIPKEPRQLMINLMYLVLTALLALNVSAEILNAFNTVNKGITESNNILTDKNAVYLSNIESTAQSDPRPETQANWEKAKQAQQISGAFADFIETYKAKIMELAGGPSDEPGKLLKTEGEMEKTSNWLLKQGKGDELKAKIEETRAEFLKLVGDNSGIEVPLNVAPVPESAKNKSWSEFNFDRVPAIALMTIMTKLQQDAKSTESTILEYLARDINIRDFKIDKMAAIVSSPSSYVRKGTEYSAKIFVGATSKAIDPQVYVGSFTAEVKKDPADPSGESFLEVKGDKPPLNNPQKLETVEGFATIKESAGAGRNYQGVIQVPDPETPGKFVYYPFESGYETFEVGKAVVSPTAMNVLYIGVDNPIKISVPGYASDKVSASGCGISHVKGEEYVARPTSVGEEAINVSVKTAKGTENSSENFRIRRIPDPYAYILNTKGGPLKIGEFKAIDYIIVKNPDFVFNIPYQVKSFEMVFAPKIGNVISDISNSNKFSQLMLDIQKKAKPGDTIVLQNVTVKMPDGTNRAINTSFKLVGG
ncbi:MAG: gliding motility protein GldM [Chitinophagales bacterium]